MEKTLEQLKEEVAIKEKEEEAKILSSIAVKVGDAVMYNGELCRVKSKYAYKGKVVLNLINNHTRSIGWTSNKRYVDKEYEKVEKIE